MNKSFGTHSSRGTRRTSWGARVLILILLAFAGLAAFVCYTVFFDNPSRAVPPLRGMTASEAVETLRCMGVKAQIEEEDSVQPAGVVLSQWPEAGVKLRVGKPVVLKISRGSGKHAVPDLRGLTRTEAEKKLQDCGFLVGDIVEIAHDRAAGTVAAQNPSAPAMVPAGYSVSLMLSKGRFAGKGRVFVPDLLQEYEDKALTLVKAAGLRTRVERVYTLASPAGMVIAQRPKKGSKVLANSEITLTVASWDKKFRQASDVLPEEKGEIAQGAQREDERTDGTVLLPAANGNTGDRRRIVVVKPATDSERARQISAAEAEELRAELKTRSGSDGATGAKRTNVINGAKKRVNERQKPQITEKGTQSPAPVQPSKIKKALIRYTAPPVKGQRIRIEFYDRQGMRVLLEREVKPREAIRISEEYSAEARVIIYLGGKYVWEDRFK